MFRRYADLFSEQEKLARQSQTQDRRREWKQAQANTIIAMPKPSVV